MPLSDFAGEKDPENPPTEPQKVEGVVIPNETKKKNDERIREIIGKLEEELSEIRRALSSTQPEAPRQSLPS
jgi:hypothetical protein